MKKSNKSNWESEEGLVIGVDLGDKQSWVCVRGADGEIRQQDRVRTNSTELSRFFTPVKPAMVVMEVGTHSPWVQRLLERLGHRVVVANPRRLKIISASDRKNDRVDAALLSELGHCMPRLLNPVRHRSAEAHADLLVIRARARMVEARSKLWNALRSMAKSMGTRLPRKIQAEHVAAWEQSLKPMWEAIGSLTEKIQEYEKVIETLVRTKYPAAQRLQQVAGVGPIIALTFVLTIEDAQRFRKSRHVGSYLGLRPKQRDSGESQPQLRITRAGDRYMRQLLVQGAQYILGKFGPDTDLRRWGLKLAARGGKNAKKRAVVAVARKLAVLLHRLWVGGEAYEPLRKQVAVSLA
jgi:transposase